MNKEILISLQKILHQIGSANDAEDHGYLEDAHSLREKNIDSIRKVILEEKWLNDLFPNLIREVASKSFLDYRWSHYSQEIEEQLKKS
jgi:hypothetical protein